MASWYYDSETATAGTAGTLADPFKVVATMLAAVSDGDTVYVNQNLDCGTSARRMSLTKSLTLRPYPGNSYFRVSGLRTVTGVSSTGTDTYRSTALASGLDASGAGTGVQTLVVDWGLRTHRSGMQACKLHRRANVKSVQTNAVTAKVISGGGSTNLITCDLASASTYYRVGDRVVGEGASGGAGVGYNSVGIVTAVSGTQVTFSTNAVDNLVTAVTLTNGTAATPGTIRLAESAFFYDNSTGQLDFTLYGQGTTLPTTVQYTFGGGASSYTGINPSGSGVTVTVYDAQIDNICDRHTSNGNAFQSSSSSVMNLISTGYLRAECVGDHAVYFGNSGTNTSGSISGACWFGGFNKHVGDSAIVSYCDSGNVSGQRIGNYTDRITIQLSISPGYDGLYNGEPLPADQGSTYTTGLWGVTAHVSTVGTNYVTDVIGRNIDVYVNPRSFQRSNALRGFPDNVQCDGFQVRNTKPESWTPASPSDTRPGAFYNCRIFDGLYFTANGGSANFYKGIKAYLTGWDRAEARTQINNNNGCIGDVGVSFLGIMEVEDSVILCNAYNASNGVIFRHARSNTSTQNLKRFTRTLFASTTPNTAGDTRLIDFGDGSFITPADIASTPGATVSTAGYLLNFVNNMTNRTEFNDCLIAHLGTANTNVFLLGQISALSPTWPKKYLRQMIAFNRCKVWGFASNRFGKSGECPAVDTQAEWSAQATASTVADTDTAWNPDGSYTDPGIGTISWAITAASRTASSSAVYTATAHGLAIGDIVAIEGVKPFVYSGTFTVTAITANTFTVDTGESTTDSGTVSGGQVTKLNFTIPSTAFINPPNKPAKSIFFPW